ncbi:hypothetical protein LCGC14_1660430 [marine sediment metagenome]|uniref:Uncharacterized protein n=1 Tax=marine sediment metagenome TaxID=412755 RepID=A0A0F9KA31_9ZZZZ
MTKQERHRRMYHRFATPWCFWLQSAGLSWLYRRYCRMVLVHGTAYVNRHISRLCYWHEEVEEEIQAT